MVTEKAGEKKYLLMSVTAGVGLVPQVEKFGREIAGDSYKNYIVIRKYDFAYNKSATKEFPEGYISMLNQHDIAAVPNSIFTCFRVTDSTSYPPFFDYLFHNNYHGLWLKKYIEVGARAHGSLSIDTKYLWNMPLALPCLEEQQKIADCLSSLDVLIDAESRKLEALKKYKKGLMQKLFPAEEKTLPELRFPEFDGQWVNNKLGDLFANRQETGFQELPLMSLTEEYGLVPQRETNKKDNSNADKSKYLRVCEGDIVYNTMRMWQGRCAHCKNEGIVSPAYTVCIPKEICDGLFFYYYFKTYRIIQKFYANSQGLVSDTLNLKFDKFSTITIDYPQPKEQQKIADYLSKIDSLIMKQSNKVTMLKTHKKGLMQGLFPPLEEVD